MASSPEHTSSSHTQSSSQGDQTKSQPEGKGGLVIQSGTSSQFEVGIDGSVPHTEGRILPYDIFNPAQVDSSTAVSPQSGSPPTGPDSSLLIKPPQYSWWYHLLFSVGSTRRRLGCLISFASAFCLFCSFSYACSAPNLARVHLPRDYHAIPDKKGLGAAFDYSVFIVYGPDAYSYFPQLYRKDSDILLLITVQPDNSLTIPNYSKHNFDGLLQVLEWMYNDAKQPVSQRTLRSAVATYLDSSTELTTPEARERFLSAFDAYSAELLVQVGPDADSYELIKYFGRQRAVYYRSLLQRKDFSVYSEQELKYLILIAGRLAEFYQSHNFFSDTDNYFNVTAFGSAREQIFWERVTFRRF